MSKSQYISWFHTESADLVQAARQHLDAPIPSCPGWTITDLLAHLGGIYGSLIQQIPARTIDDVVQELEDVHFDPVYEEWYRRDTPASARPADLMTWFERLARDLENVFSAADPHDPAWSWYTPDQTAGFWMRRMAHETAIHRWDAQLAQGSPQSFDREEAVDGVDEALFVYMPTHCRPKSSVVGQGEKFHFHCTDGEGEWLVRFEADGMGVTREHAKGDVAIRGAASDLFLFMWHRISLDRLEVIGNKTLADRYFEFCPPD